MSIFTDPANRFFNIARREGERKVGREYPISLALTLNSVQSNSIVKSSFWTLGGGAQVGWKLGQSLSLVADVQGSHAANINSTGVGLDLVTFTFGPRFSLTPRASRCSLYGQALAGVAKGYNGVFPSPSGEQSNAGSVALLMGGGMDVRLRSRVALRVFEADWLYTQAAQLNHRCAEQPPPRRGHRGAVSVSWRGLCIRLRMGRRTAGGTPLLGSFWNHWQAKRKSNARAC